MTDTTTPRTQNNAEGFVPALRRLLGRAIPWVLVLATPLVLLRLIAIHQVNIPFLDDWMFVHQFAKEPNGFLESNGRRGRRLPTQS